MIEVLTLISDICLTFFLSLGAVRLYLGRKEFHRFADESDKEF